MKFLPHLKRFSGSGVVKKFHFNFLALVMVHIKGPHAQKYISENKARELEWYASGEGNRNQKEASILTLRPVTHMNSHAPYCCHFMLM